METGPFLSPFRVIAVRIGVAIQPKDCCKSGVHLERATRQARNVLIFNFLVCSLCFSETKIEKRHCLQILGYHHHQYFISKKNQDGKRCGKTIAQLFEKAKDPNKVFIGLIEQNSETDLFCLEAYCQEHGVDIYQKKSIRKDTTKILTTTRKKSCPRMDQIRTLAVHHVDAKGPSYARSLARKVLGNEEFCLQIDAHTDVVSEWDDKLQHEWAATGNEFGIISTVPAALSERETLAVNTVPRQCAMNFLETGVPVRNITHRLVRSGVHLPKRGCCW
jgi:hypothetical protein